MQADEYVVGKPRPVNNPIINALKSEVGKPKKYNNYQVHDVHYTYGAPLKRDPESAGEVMLSWKEHEPPTREIDLGRDFVRLNKEAARAGAANASSVQAYRESHDARIRPQVSLQKNKAPLKMDPGIAFGRKSCLDGVTVRELVQNKFEMDWVEEQWERQGRREARAARKVALREQSPLRVRATPSPHAFYYTQQSKAPSAADSFTLRRFQDVPSRVHVSRSGSPHKGGSRNFTTPTLPPVGGHSHNYRSMDDDDYDY
jgi:hypothetical protein